MTANGRPEAEVIVNFQDGLSYNKKKLEEAFASGVFDTPSRRTKDTSHSSDVKKEHVELIAQEFDMTKAQAEKALARHKGDLATTLRALVASPAS